MPSDPEHAHAKALEQRIEELQATLATVKDDLSSLRSAVVYTYGALVALYIDSKQGADSERYSAALDKISGALDKTLGLGPGA